MWAIYAIVALALAYFQFRKGEHKAETTQKADIKTEQELLPFGYASDKSRSTDRCPL